MPATYSYDVAITVTLPSSARKLSTEQQYSLYVDEYLNILNKHKHTSVVELTLNYDVHFHSLVSFKDLEKDVQPLMYAKNLFRKTFGQTCIKQSTDSENWCKYMFKDLNKTNDMIKGRCLLRDDYEAYVYWQELDDSERSYKKHIT